MRTQLPQQISRQRPVFSATDELKTKNLGMVTNFDPYSALMIDRGNRILIVFHFFCCSKHKLSTILIAIVASLVRFITLTLRFKKLLKFFCLFYLYDWITIMAYSKNELGTINTLYFPKKKFHITPLPPHNGHLCTTATFFVLSPGKETSYTDLTLFFFPWSWEIWVRDYRQGGRCGKV